jgi:hypothetical protein
MSPSTERSDVPVDGDADSAIVNWRVPALASVGLAGPAQVPVSAAVDGVDGLEQLTTAMSAQNRERDT